MSSPDHHELDSKHHMKKSKEYQITLKIKIGVKTNKSRKKLRRKAKSLVEKAINNYYEQCSFSEKGEEYLDDKSKIKIKRIKQP